MGEVYEYGVKTWGGFYNPENIAKHGHKPGTFIFSTKKERDDYIACLNALSGEHNAKMLATTVFEGYDARFECIAKMKLVYNGVPYDYEMNFGCGYDAESARYMFEDGNYSCDCNRILFLNQTYGLDIPEHVCGDKIEMVDFVVVFQEIYGLDNAR